MARLRFGTPNTADNLERLPRYTRVTSRARVSRAVVSLAAARDWNCDCPGLHLRRHTCVGGDRQHGVAVVAGRPSILIYGTLVIQTATKLTVSTGGEQIRLRVTVTPQQNVAVPPAGKQDSTAQDYHSVHRVSTTVTVLLRTCDTQHTTYTARESAGVMGHVCVRVRVLGWGVGNTE